MKRPTTSALVFSLVCGLAACGVESDDPGEDFSFDNPAEAISTPVTVTAGRTQEVRFSTTGSRLYSVVVNCAPSSNPDDVGMTFRLNAPDLNVTASDPTRAGYYSWTGTLSAGMHTVSITGVAGTGSCRVTTGVAAGTCGRTVFRSPNANHTHFRVGADTSSDWETFPASGNHWGAWAAWGMVYRRPVLRGFLLHGLEHGGIALTYKCVSSTESAACADAERQLTALAQRFGNRRFIITPDPTQRTRFAVRAWRWGYSAECLDVDTVLQFMRARYRHGREDIDADPPIPYDPSTTNVPCRDLMAAPDSC